jgi:hypothetical protein
MNGWVALAGAVVLSSMTAAPVLAGSWEHGGWERGGWQYRRGGWCHLASCPCCQGPYSIYRYHPAQEFVAAYYTSPHGVGVGYTTSAYSTNGYLRWLRN